MRPVAGPGSFVTHRPPHPGVSPTRARRRPPVESGRLDRAVGDEHPVPARTNARKGGHLGAEHARGPDGAGTGSYVTWCPDRPSKRRNLPTGAEAAPSVPRRPLDARSSTDMRDSALHLGDGRQVVLLGDGLESPPRHSCPPRPTRDPRRTTRRRTAAAAAPEGRTVRRAASPRRSRGTRPTTSAATSAASPHRSARRRPGTRDRRPASPLREPRSHRPRLLRRPTRRRRRRHPPM